MTTSYCFVEPEGQSLAMFLRIIKLGASAQTFALACGNDTPASMLVKELNVEHARATCICTDGGRVAGVEYERAGKIQKIETDRVICAVPAPAAAVLLDDQAELAAALRAIPYSDIVLAHLYLDRPLPNRAFTYLFSRAAGHHAAFAIDCKRKCPAAFRDGCSILQLHFPSPLATELLAAPDADVIALATADAEHYFPEIRSWIVRTDVHRRANAVPSFRCGMFQQIRAAERAGHRIVGLYLAGDYLRAPLAEGAARAGVAAAITAALT